MQRKTNYEYKQPCNQLHVQSQPATTFKVNNRNTRTRCEICSKLTIKTPEWWTYFTSCSSVPIGNFYQVNAGWDWVCSSVFTVNFQHSMQYFIWTLNRLNRRLRVVYSATIKSLSSFEQVLIFKEILGNVASGITNLAFITRSLYVFLFVKKYWNYII